MDIISLSQVTCIFAVGGCEDCQIRKTSFHASFLLQSSLSVGCSDYRKGADESPLLFFREIEALEVVWCDWL